MSLLPAISTQRTTRNEILMTVISMYTQYIFGEKIVVIFAFENQRERPLLNLFDNGYIHLQLERHFSEDYILMLTVRTLLEF